MQTGEDKVIKARNEVERLLQIFANTNNNSRNLSDIDTALFDIFTHCGVPWQREIPISYGNRKHEIDGDLELIIDGKPQKFLVEIKHSVRLERISKAIEAAKRYKNIGRYDRALVIVPADIPNEVRHAAENSLVGSIDLLGISELRSWLCKYIPALREDEAPQHRTCAHIIREAMRAIAERLALAPDEIGTIEWRDLERVLREVFEGMGFNTTLTRSGKDGGFDLELVTNAEEGREIYLVEVKHWTQQKPGSSHLKKLVRVTAQQKANYGILLSSSGFAPSIFEGITSRARKNVRLGGRDKIISLCSTYYRIGKQIWEPAPSMSENLMADLI